VLKPLGPALRTWLPRDRATERAADPLVAISLAWAEIVGDEVAAQTQPTQITGSALVVTTRSSAWSQQLSFLAETILAELHRRVPHANVERLRFRVGRLHAARPRGSAPARESGPVPRANVRPPSESVEASLARFRQDVEARRRAKRAAGWKEWPRCSAAIAPSSATWCVACGVALDDERSRTIARLLFEAPWTSYEGVVSVLGDVPAHEYQAVSARLLSRWWEMLTRTRASRRLSSDRRERMIASAYVMLKSGIAPERIAPATVRNVLGDELYAVLYETESINETNGK